MHGAGIRRVGLLVLVGGMLWGCDRADAVPDDEVAVANAMGLEAAANLPPGVTPEMAEGGRQLFLPCAVCHGLDGRGNQLGPSLRDAEWTHIAGTLEEIEDLIRTGVPEPKSYPVPMAPMGGGDFDAEELRAVASYVFAISQTAASSATSARDSTPPSAP